MTKSIFFAAAALVASACFLAAQPQQLDSTGITVDMNGAPYIHRTPVGYPKEALDKGIEGTVVAQLKIGADGQVVDAAVVSGPDELRRGVLQSVLNWHFSKSIAGTTREISVNFKAGKREAGAAANALPAAVRPPASAESQPSRTIKSIEIGGLSEEGKAQLLSQLPVHEGETLTPEIRAKITQQLAQFDPHLGVLTMPADANSVTLRIGVGYPSNLAAETATPTRIRVGGNVQQAKLVSQPRPVYPPDAKTAGVQGTVVLDAIIARDGTVEKLTVISGDPLLVESAVAAVSHWVYATTLLNGNPVEVETQINVNYTLSQ